MVNEFTREPVAKVPKTRFHFTPTHDTTGQFFMCMPTFCKTLVPGDVVKWFNTSCFGRAISLEAPILNKIRIRHDIFFVSYNSMDSEFKHFLPRVTPDDSTSSTPNDIEFPTLSKFDIFDSNGKMFINDISPGSLLDRLGIKFANSSLSVDKDGIPSQISAFSVFAYQRICDKYFTNFDLQDNLYLDTDIRDCFVDAEKESYGADILNLRYCNWSYDYFTSALPWVQRFPSPEIDLTNAFIKTGSWNQVGTTGGALIGSLSPVRYGQSPSSSTIASVSASAGSSGVLTLTEEKSSLYNTNDYKLMSDSSIPLHSEVVSKFNSYNLSAEIEGTTVTINQLRDSMLLHMMLEAQARGGSRYDELSLTMYGIAPSNEVLHEPLWLGGYTQNLMTSEVVSMSSNSDNDGYLGNLAGHGITSENGNMIDDDFVVKEFGILIQITRIYPEQIYSQGVPREFLYTDFFGSIFNPMFNNMSNQPVYAQELYNDGTKIDLDSSDDHFGYNGIYDYMRTMENSVSGDLRNNNLKYWLATREFASKPELNASFVNGENSIDSLNNIFSVTNADPFILHFDFDIEMLRPIPAVAIPQFTAI